MTYACMMRVRNESRWIAEVIDSVLPLCERVFVMDDHSTDNTAEICARYGAVKVLPSQFAGFDEARDKNWLFAQMLQEIRPDWVLCIDGDEVLEKNGPEIIRESCETGTHEAHALKIVFLWNDPNTARVDRVYDYFHRPSLFKPFYGDREIEKELNSWLSTPFGHSANGESPNLHCSSVPQRRLHNHGKCPARLKHYGYMDRQKRVEKLDFYTSIDWKNAAEDSYRHMCQADNVRLDELPKTRDLMARGVLTQADVQYMLDTPPHARLVHAGPIELRAFVE